MDITLVIRKTLVYSVVTGVLTAIYFAAVALSFRLVGTLHGFPTLISSLFAAGVITAVFNPLRRRVQALADRYFFPEEKWQAAEELARGMAHEIKRPVAAIGLPAELTLMDLEDIANGKGALEEILPEAKKRLQYIMKQITEASSKIDAIRELTHPQSEESQESVELPKVIHKSLSNLKPLLRESKVEVKVELPEGVGPVKGSARQLEIVFENLFKNAAEAMVNTAPHPLPLPRGERVKGEGGVPRDDNSKLETRNSKRFHGLQVRAWEENGAVFISVRDSGPGIPPEHLKHVFEPSYSTKGPRGMGMGLYLAQKAVKANGGAIEVKSEVGQGTEFVVRLREMSCIEPA